MCEPHTLWKNAKLPHCFQRLITFLLFPMTPQQQKVLTHHWSDCAVLWCKNRVRRIQNVPTLEKITILCELRSFWINHPSRNAASDVTRKGHYPSLLHREGKGQSEGKGGSKQSTSITYSGEYLKAGRGAHILKPIREGTLQQGNQCHLTLYSEPSPL